MAIAYNDIRRAIWAMEEHKRAQRVFFFETETRGVG